MDSDRTELRLWKQTIEAFGVEHWCMSPTNNVVYTSPIQHADMEAALAAHPGKKTFMIMPGRMDPVADLKTYVHPENAIYVFGCGTDNLVGHVTADDDVVGMHTPSLTAMFGSAAVAAVLWDRLQKS